MQIVFTPAIKTAIKQTHSAREFFNDTVTAKVFIKDVNARGGKVGTPLDDNEPLAE
jgi:hypothetical protein